MKVFLKNLIEKVISSNIYLIKFYRSLVFYFFLKNKYIYNLLYKLKPKEKFFYKNKNRYVQDKFMKFDYLYDLTDVMDNWNFFGTTLLHNVYGSINSKISKAKTILDIGANHGFFSLECLNYNSDCIIYAFEPNLKNYELIKNNISLNNISQIKLFNFGFYSSDKTLVELNDNPTNSGMFYYLENKQKDTDLKKNKFIVADDFIEENSLDSIDVIKIDVEGAEYHVLLGLKNYLSKADPVIHIEIDHAALSKFDSSLDEIIKLLKECEFKIFEKINYENDNNHYDMVCRKN